MCRLDRGKYEKIKEVQEVKNTENRVHFCEGMNKEIPHQMESEGSTKSDDAYIPRQVWDERVFMNFPLVQFVDGQY